MKLLKSIVAAAALSLMVATGALAQVSFHLQLNPQVQTVGPNSPGNPQTVTFNATLRNLGSVDLEIAGYNFTLDDPLIFDDTKFFANVPTTLLAGQSVNVALFDVIIPAGTNPGTWNGNIGILGRQVGVGGIGELDNSHFQVTMVDVPEGSSLWLFLAAMVGGALVVRFRPRRPSAELVRAE